MHTEPEETLYWTGWTLSLKYLLFTYHFCNPFYTWWVLKNQTICELRDTDTQYWECNNNTTGWTLARNKGTQPRYCFQKSKQVIFSGKLNFIEISQDIWDEILQGLHIYLFNNLFYINIGFIDSFCRISQVINDLGGKKSLTTRKSNTNRRRRWYWTFSQAYVSGTVLSALCV